MYTISSFNLIFMEYLEKTAVSNGLSHCLLAVFFLCQVNGLKKGMMPRQQLKKHTGSNECNIKIFNKLCFVITKE